MSDAKTRIYYFLLIFLVLIPFLSFRITSHFLFPYPPLNQLVFDIGEEFADKISYERPLGSEGGFRDFAGLLLGLHRLIADIGWVSVLQYYGTHEEEETDQPHPFGGGKYPALKKLVLRVVRLDPSLHYATLYGAGALGWNLNRPQEAMELLEEAIKYNPTYWRFRLYVGAIIYKQKGEFGNMIRLLEDAIQYPDCPTLVKSVLAGIYKERKNYRRALEIWIEILENPQTDSWYQMQAKKQMKELSGRRY